jgi:putative spermidine/putrescine transport system ATP-binding protein
MTTFQELSLEAVTRSFGGVVALRNLDLTIKAGEFVSLLGPSGCGKSTALGCIAGLLSLTSGAIRLDGKRVDTLPPERRGFGMVFQSYALFPHLTVRRNVAFGLEMQGVAGTQIARRVEDALRLVRLEHLGERLPGQLSGGQQQRVAIARAVVIEPPLVLMDEPLSNLDAKLRVEMRHEIRRLHNALGLTTIYVTHDQDEALSLSDRIVVMKDGAKLQEGPPEELYLHPAQVDVARFMGFRNVFNADAYADGSVAAGSLTLQRAQQEAANSPAQGPVTVAFRPDDVKVDGAGPVEATVGLVEYCGRDWLVDLKLDDGQLVLARVEERLSEGARIRFGVLPDRLRIYDREATV